MIGPSFLQHSKARQPPFVDTPLAATRDARALLLGKDNHYGLVFGVHVHQFAVRCTCMISL